MLPPEFTSLSPVTLYSLLPFRYEMVWEPYRGTVRPVVVWSKGLGSLGYLSLEVWVGQGRQTMPCHRGQKCMGLMGAHQNHGADRLWFCPSCQDGPPMDLMAQVGKIGGDKGWHCLHTGLISPGSAWLLLGVCHSNSTLEASEPVRELCLGVVGEPSFFLSSQGN